MKPTSAFIIAAAITATTALAQTATARNWLETSAPYQKMVEGVKVPLPYFRQRQDPPEP